MSKRFYLPKDEPTAQEKEKMWNAVEWSLAEHHKLPLYSVHWKSFWLGMAASLLILFSATGIYTIAVMVSSTNQNGILTLDSQYNKALKQLVAITPFVLRKAGDVERPVLESQIQNLEDIDNMIDEIRNDMLLNGSSEIKRRQLKRLYALKMDSVKEILLSDNIAL